MKLYTRTGDDGSTGLFGGKRVSKASLRVSAYGDVDELNSALGYLRNLEPWAELDAWVLRVQSELFDLGSNLALDPESEFAAHVPPLTSAMIETLEREIDQSQAQSPELKNFILPGGTALASWLFLVRTIARRAERSTVLLAESEAVDATAILYLNRLSDLLFALGREANARAGIVEPQWKGRG